MARMIICSNLPEFTKEIRYDMDVEVTIDTIEDEVLKRMKTILANGKITCQANYEGYHEDKGWQLYSVAVYNYAGTHFVTCFVRVYQFDKDKDLP